MTEPGACKIEIKPSQSEGLGIFAGMAFATGDHILDVVYEREITRSSPLNTAAGERIDHCAYPDGKMMLVAYPSRHMNHSCDPNAYYDYESGSVKSCRSAIVHSL